MWTGPAIKQERRARGWSQKELAKKVGALTGEPDLTASAVGQWENGGNPSIKNLRALTALFAPELLERSVGVADEVAILSQRQDDALASLAQIAGTLEGIQVSLGEGQKEMLRKIEETRADILARLPEAEPDAPQRGGSQRRAGGGSRR